MSASAVDPELEPEVLEPDVLEPVYVRIDGIAEALRASASTSLLRALRDNGHTQVLGACEQGECGSCTIVIDGRMECACLVPVAICEGADIRTVRSEITSDLEVAMAQAGAVQCGFCTPGIVVAAQTALQSSVPLTTDAVKEALAGNLCRCTGYQAIIAAVIHVDQQRRNLI
jgi:carbon-monoxide dehydrogenase small subunit